MGGLSPERRPSAYRSRRDAAHQAAGPWRARYVRVPGRLWRLRWSRPIGYSVPAAACLRPRAESVQIGSARRGRVVGDPKRGGSAPGLAARLRDWQASALPFLHNANVPSTSNPAEREVRRTKLRRKVPGGLRPAQRPGIAPPRPIRWRPRERAGATTLKPCGKGPTSCSPTCAPSGYPEPPRPESPASRTRHAPFESLRPNRTHLPRQLPFKCNLSRRSEPMIEMPLYA